MTLAGGAGVAQAITLVAAPVLTRVYSPGDYGVVTAFSAITVVFAGSSSLRYQIAVVTARRRRTSIEVAWLSMAVLCLVSLLVAAGTAVAWILGPDWSFVETLGPWLLVVPLAVFLEGVVSIGWQWNTRQGEFHVTSGATVARAGVSAGASVALGVGGAGAGGLLTGGVLGALINALLTWRSLARGFFERRPHLGRLLRLARAYSRFPSLELPAALVAGVTLAVAPSFVVAYYSQDSAGQFGLAFRVVQLPVAILGGAIAQVYFRAASRASQGGGDPRGVLDRTIKYSFVVSGVPFIALAIVAPWLFPVVFGPEWSQAGVFAQAMIPLVWVQLVATAIRSTFTVHRRQHVMLAWSTMALAAAGGACLLALLMDASALQFVWLSSLLGMPVAALTVVWARRSTRDVRSPDRGLGNQ